jgi:riboflavin biosynthesis pyrimidine reductase
MILLQKSVPRLGLIAARTAELSGKWISRRTIDELFLTLAPQIAGRQSLAQRPSIAGETLFSPEMAPWFGLRSIKRAWDHLLLRYTSPQL